MSSRCQRSSATSGDWAISGDKSRLVPCAVAAARRHCRSGEAIDGALRGRDCRRGQRRHASGQLPCQRRLLRAWRLRRSRLTMLTVERCATHMSSTL